MLAPADVFAKRVPERTQRVDELLTFGGIAQVAERQHDDVGAVNLLGEKGQRWGLPQHAPRAEFLGCRGGKGAVLLENALRLAEGEDDEAAEKVRADLV